MIRVVCPYCGVERRAMPHEWPVLASFADAAKECDHLVFAVSNFSYRDGFEVAPSEWWCGDHYADSTLVRWHRMALKRILHRHDGSIRLENIRVEHMVLLSVRGGNEDPERETMYPRGLAHLVCVFSIRPIEFSRNLLRASRLLDDLDHDPLPRACIRRVRGGEDARCVKCSRSAWKGFDFAVFLDGTDAMLCQECSAADVPDLADLVRRTNSGGR